METQRPTSDDDARDAELRFLRSVAAEAAGRTLPELVGSRLRQLYERIQELRELVEQRDAMIAGQARHIDELHREMEGLQQQRANAEAAERQRTT